MAMMPTNLKKSRTAGDNSYVLPNIQLKYITHYPQAAPERAVDGLIPDGFVGSLTSSERRFAAYLSLDLIFIVGSFCTLAL